MEMKHTKDELRLWQALPLNIKVSMTKERIRQWVNEFGTDGVCVSFSGGKDSTALLHIVRSIYPNIIAVFSNTGLEYPEIQKFVRGFDNTEVIRPAMMFRDVILKYGYPIIGKEVAEAIYYARKIRGGQQTANKRQELMGNRTTLSRQAQREIEEQFSQAKCQGNRQETSRTPRLTSERETYSRGTCKRTARLRRKAGVASGKTGEEDAFSNSAEKFGEKSQFNKEKWLPIARDLPFKVSHMCCNEMKKKPLHHWQTKHKCKPILATMAEESRVRKQAWLKNGCNAYDGYKAKSQPMSFWTEQDVLQYIVLNGLEIASVYGDIVTVDEDGFEYPATPMSCDGCKLKCTGCERTGCIFCGFGFHLEKKGETRFQRLAKTHPKLYEYAIGGGEWTDNPDYDSTAPDMDGEWKNWNPKKIWVPSKEGLGMKKVFDMCNEVMGRSFYRYD